MILFSGDTHSRSVLKAISWRTLGTLDTFAISWFLTGKVGLRAPLPLSSSQPNRVVLPARARVGCRPLGTTLTTATIPGLIRTMRGEARRATS